MAFELSLKQCGRVQLREAGKKKVWASTESHSVCLEGRGGGLRGDSVGIVHVTCGRHNSEIWKRREGNWVYWMGTVVPVAVEIHGPETGAPQS